MLQLPLSLAGLGPDVRDLRGVFAGAGSKRCHSNYIELFTVTYLPILGLCDGWACNVVSDLATGLLEKLGKHLGGFLQFLHGLEYWCPISNTSSDVK